MTTSVVENNYTEQTFDYSTGVKVPELILMVGVGGSGKSTTAKEMVNSSKGETIRINRDDLRKMLYVDVPWSNKLEECTKAVQMESAEAALKLGKNVIIDDTNCHWSVRDKWSDLAYRKGLKYRILTMNTPLDECILRDSKRTDKEHIGKDIIIKQYQTLTGGGWQKTESVPYLKRIQLHRKKVLSTRLIGEPWVIVDVDGTVAHNATRSHYDESRVIEDTTHDLIVKWVRVLYESYNICFVSGRHDSCGDQTWKWLEKNNIPFDCLLMRYSSDNRSDFIIKKEILEELKAAGANIAFAIDDRPRIIRMWKENGIMAIPVRGWTDHTVGCFYTTRKKYEVCPECGALEDF